MHSGLNGNHFASSYYAEPPATTSASGSRSGSTSTLERAGLSGFGTSSAAAAAATHRRITPGCKTEQLMERQKAQVVAVMSKDSAFNLRCLWVGWVFMCWVSGMMTAAGFLLPYWLKGSRQASDVKKQLSDLGLFRLCAYPRQVDGQVRLVMDCGHYRHFVEIPSPLWKLAFVLMATACCLLLLLTFFLAFTGFRLFILRIRSVVAICGAAQGFSSLFVLTSCLLYPAGWGGNPDVAQVCGPDADSFKLGHCHLGWAYVLTCAGGFLCAVTVAFPAQIAKHFPEEAAPPVLAPPVAAATASRSAASYHHYQPQTIGGSHQALLQSSPLASCGNGAARYNYIVYQSLQPTPQHHMPHHHHSHNLQQQQQQQQAQQLSRPPSVCTCSIADCQNQTLGCDALLEAVAADSGQAGPSASSSATVASSGVCGDAMPVVVSGNGQAINGRFSDLAEESDGNAGAAVA